jgi:hypothetical protein
MSQVSTARLDLRSPRNGPVSFDTLRSMGDIIPASGEGTREPEATAETADRTAPTVDLRRGLSWIWRNTDQLTKWLQVLALLAAAGWTIYKFRGLEASSFERNAAVSVELKPEWHADSAGGTCWTNVVVEVNNIGTRSFDVAKINLEAWFVGMPVRATGTFEVLDLPRIEHEQPSLWKRTPDSGLIRHFSPKSDLHDAFTWISYGRPPAGLYIVRAEILDKPGQSIGFATAWKNSLCP